MSYIEREAAYPLAKKIVDAVHSGEYSSIQLPHFILDAIDDIPAADVRPVARGKWELSDETPYIRKHYHTVACSNCHRAGMKGWNYCPNCGARMEES